VNLNVFTAFSDNFRNTFISFIHLRGLRWETRVFHPYLFDLSSTSAYLPATMKIKIPISVGRQARRLSYILNPKMPAGCQRS
jgi:hypothetical protein